MFIYVINVLWDGRCRGGKVVGLSVQMWRWMWRWIWLWRGDYVEVNVEVNMAVEMNIEGVEVNMGGVEVVIGSSNVSPPLRIILISSSQFN